MGTAASEEAVEDTRLHAPIPISSPGGSHKARPSPPGPRPALKPPSFGSSQKGAQSSEPLVPVVIRYTGPHAREVSVQAWPQNGAAPPTTEKITMKRSDSEKNFMAILQLPPGTHHYRFEVDGRWTFSQDQPLSRSGANVTNSVVVKAPEGLSISSPQKTSFVTSHGSVSSPSYNMLSGSPPGGYTTELNVDFSNGTNKGPTELPPHLERALLNCAPVADDPDQLPLPHRVMLNHVYLRPPRHHRDAVIYGVSSRYGDKYVTTVFYKRSQF